MNKLSTRLNRRIFIVVILAYVSGLLLAFPREQILQGIKGPWELCVKIGVQESDIIFPIKVADENAAQTLDQSLPVIGTPIHVKLLRYLPDFEWRTKIIEDPEGGPVAQLTVVGNNLNQEVLLLADVPEKHSVTARIGGLALREINNPSGPKAILEDIIKERAVGLLTFWPTPDTPQEFVVGPKDTFDIPGTSFKVEVLEYIPHYSIDRETKKVTSYSQAPVNPALKIRLSDGEESHEHWLWSNFSSSPHTQSKLPIKTKFFDFDLGPSVNRFFLIAADSADTFLYYQKEKSPQFEVMQVNEPYHFKGGEYTFTLDSLVHKAVVDRTWGNASDRLEHPAVVLSVQSGQDSQETVAELNKPAHVKTEYGTVVLLYRQQTQQRQHGEK